MKLVGVHLETFEAESAVSPILTKVAIHGIMLNKRNILKYFVLKLFCLTMSISEMGPILRIKMLTFTSVGPVYKHKRFSICQQKIFDKFLTLTWWSLRLIIVHQKLLQDPERGMSLVISKEHQGLSHLVTLLLNF